MAKLRLGYYTLDFDKTLEHTYARMSMKDGDGFPVMFYCWGSVYSDNKHVYPAHFCQIDGKKVATEFECNGTITKQLIC